MEPFDSIEKLISEHGSAAVLRDHIALLKSQMEEKDAKIKDLIFQVEHLKRLLKEKDAQLQNLTRQKSPADACPYCREPSGILNDIRPSPNPDFAFLGVKQGYYKCSNCQKEYDKEMPSDGA
jgi:hypothetical protein